MRHVGTNEDVAARIQTEREKRGWNYRDLAARVEAETGFQISKDTLRRIEVENAKIHVDQLVALAQVFGLTIVEMLEPAQWIRELEANHLKRVGYRATKRIEQGVIEIIAAGKRLALIDEETSDLLYARGRSPFKTDLSIPSAAGLVEYMEGLIGTALMLGLQLGHDTYRTAGTPVSYPDMRESEIGIKKPLFGEFEGPMAASDDWDSYLKALDAAVEGYMTMLAAEQNQARKARQS